MNKIARKFGEVYQYNWCYGDSGVDLVAHLAQFTDIGASIAEELGLPEHDISEGGFRTFRPLIKGDSPNCILLLERYKDLSTWAMLEQIAQTHPKWMDVVLKDHANERTRLEEGYLMMDDALDPPRQLDSDQISVDWMIFDTGKKEAVVEMPLLVRELTEAIEEAGFDETSVRYFAMNTGAGQAANLSHIWLEHTSPAVMAEVLSWRETSTRLTDWRKELNRTAPKVQSHHLLTQVVNEK